MSNGQPLKAKLQTLLSGQARELTAFVALLAREQSALLASDLDQLIPLAQTKSEACARLARDDHTRNEMLVAAGFGSGRAGMASWLDSQPPQAGVRRDWQSLLELAIRAQTLNRQNGELIKIRLAHNQQALAVLLAAADQAALYGPDGQSLARLGGRVISSA